MMGILWRCGSVMIGILWRCGGVVISAFRTTDLKVCDMRPGMHFSKVLKTFWARKPECLPIKIPFLLILKAKQ